MSNIKEKIKNAYLLFYERIVPITEDLTACKIQELKKEESKELETTENFNESKIKLLENSKNTPDILESNEAKKSDLYQEEFLQEILKDNLKFHIHKNIFSTEYFNFIVELVSKRKYDENNDYLEFPFQYKEAENPKKIYDLELLKLGTLFLLTCIIREKEKQNLVTFLPFLKQELSKVCFNLLIIIVYFFH